MEETRTADMPRYWLAAILALLTIANPLSASADQLGSYRIRSSKIFVAGISSGGAMAVQMHFAYSHLFKGSAIYAGLPYGCAQDSEATALTTCQEDTPPIDLASLEATARQYATSHLIDPLSNLSGQPVYLWSGTLDVTVRQPAMDDVKTFYQDFRANVFQYDNNFDAAHGWESPLGPNACQVEDTPFIILCDNSDRSGGGDSNAYDSEQVWLTKFFGKLNPRNNGTLGGATIRFDQNEFAPDDNAAGITMDSTGFAFVPKGCANRASCGLVLALHGCNQDSADVGTAFVDDAGINEWADTNNIVVLYPQTISSTPANPAACWDWWGYQNDPNYAQKAGPQMRALYLMVNRVSGVRD